MNPLTPLSALGQSVWLDFVCRELLTRARSLAEAFDKLLNAVEAMREAA